MGKNLVFSVACNGYWWRFQKNIESHRRYAERFGYDYVCISEPQFSSLGIEVAWLKIPLILKAFERGYKNVMFLDADTEVRPSAPCFTEVLDGDKALCFSRGYSGRINSGVIITRRSINTANYFRSILASCEQGVPEEDSVGWGENGHIIHHSKGKDFVGIISSKWNNNHDHNLEDYIRHYSAGPLRSSYQERLMNRCVFILVKWVNGLLKRVFPNPIINSKGAKLAAINDLCNQVCSRYSFYFGN